MSTIVPGASWRCSVLVRATACPRISLALSCSRTERPVVAGSTGNVGGLGLADVVATDCDGEPTGTEVRLGGPRPTAPPVDVHVQRVVHITSIL